MDEVTVKASCLDCKFGFHYNEHIRGTVEETICRIFGDHPPKWADFHDPHNILKIHKFWPYTNCMTYQKGEL